MNKFLHRSMITLIIFLLALQVNAQQRTVTGTVRAEDGGEALIGVTVTLKGTSFGTTTNANGGYSISVPGNQAVLVFTYVGFTSREITVGANQTVNVSLATDDTSLDEIVVVGYGTQRKSDMTGSVSSVKGKDLTMLPTQRADQALQGRAAGVLVLNTDGAPGGNTTIRIRGMNSIQGGNSALIVIDGLQGGNLNSLNPNDIESLEVLKDASATAIYGSQGANGVILITTKMGRVGKPTINYSYDVGVASLREKMDLLSAADYAKTINAVELAKNGSGKIPKPIFSDAEVQQFETNGGTDWQSAVYRDATTQNHQLSIGGGTNEMNYLVSGGFLDQEGILVNSGYKRYSLRANLKTDITKWAGFGLNWSGSKEISNSVLFGGSTDWPNNPIGAATRMSPTIPIYDANGDYSKSSLHYGNPTLWNPLASALEPFMENNTIRNNINSYLEFKPLEGLSFRVTLGASVINRNNLGFYNQKTFTGSLNKGEGSVYEANSTYLQNSNILTYDKAINEHRFTITAVAEQTHSKSFNSNVDGNDFVIQQTGVFDMAGARIVRNTSSASERNINSFLGRINYVYADKYLLTASYRADGSSVFGKNNKWGYFPSVSAAWNVAKESFIGDMDIFSELKLRASWGKTGNQGIGTYGTLAKISSGRNYPYDGSDATDLGFYMSSASSPSLRWETTAQTNWGIDIGLMRGRITATADYYEKKTTDLLMPRELPRYTGLASVIDNVGSMGNKGFEFAIAGDPLIGAFAWNTGFNISANKTTVLDLGSVDRLGYRSGGSGQGTNLPFMYLIKGEPFGQMVGWGYEGVWSESERAAAAAYGQLPGDPKYTDTNGDGKINVDDVKTIGNSMPDFIFGWNNRLTYQNFELAFQIQGSQGNDLFNVARIALERPGEGTSTRLLDRWTPQNQNTDIPAIIDEKTREASQLVNKITFPSTDSNRLSRYIEDASYVRLKNVTIAYNFPKSLTERINLSNLRIYASATNLLTITNYTGYDPEVSSFTGNDAQIGSDYNNYPQSKIFNLGLNISF